MIENGSHPQLVYHKNYGFEATFGSIAPEVLPDEYDVDAGLTMPDQNADGYPNGCTGYTQADIGGDEDLAIYNPAFTYKKTLLMQGLPDGVGCDIKTSIKSTVVYGLQGKDETEQDALQHRRGTYFDVDKVGDYFDGFRSALWLNRLQRRGISLGSPWFPEWQNPDSSGVLGDFTYSGYPSQYPWHNYKCAGWTAKNTHGKLINNGELFLKLKPWQGSHFGDKGWVYMSRAVADKCFAIYGTAAFTYAKAIAGDVSLVNLSIMDTLLSYYYRLLELLNKQKQNLGFV